MSAWYPKTKKVCKDCQREFVGGPPARYCQACRPKHRGRGRRKYFWTPERDAVLRRFYEHKTRRRKKLAAEAIGYPAWEVHKRATVLGLTYPMDRKDWTPDEERFLWEHTGTRTAHWMGKKLGRSESVTILKLKRMKISRRIRSDTYMLRELELCFGVDHHLIERWVQAGKLEVGRRGTERVDKQGDIWSVSEAAILRFIRDHPMEFPLHKVDQFWFMDLITNGGLVRRALEAARETETTEEEDDATDRRSHSTGA